MQTELDAFLLTRPSRGATESVPYENLQYNDFYSHAPRGARPALDGQFVAKENFYSHAPRGARPILVETALKAYNISTHTPLAGRDPLHLVCDSEALPIYRGADFFILKSI